MIKLSGQHTSAEVVLPVEHYLPALSAPALSALLEFSIVQITNLCVKAVFVVGKNGAIAA
tara:strand:+ start:186 stop:365 length:180 start_codon:yes stop_codon:yes gene_type:complete